MAEKTPGTYVWQAEKPLHMGRYQEIQKGERFTPSSRVVRAFGDLMATPEEAEEERKVAEIEAKAAEEIAAAQAAKAETEAKRAEAEAQAQAKRAEAAAEAPRYSSTAQPKRSTKE